MSNNFEEVSGILDYNFKYIKNGWTVPGAFTSGNRYWVLSVDASESMVLAGLPVGYAAVDTENNMILAQAFKMHAHAHPDVDVGPKKEQLFKAIVDTWGNMGWSYAKLSTQYPGGYLTGWVSTMSVVLSNDADNFDPTSVSTGDLEEILEPSLYNGMLDRFNKAGVNLSVDATQLVDELRYNLISQYTGAIESVYPAPTTEMLTHKKSAEVLAFPTEV